MVEPSQPGSPPGQQLSEQEQVKAASRYLRGTIPQSLANPLTGSVTESDGQLLKFHGTYQQDDRDLREERARQRLEPAYEFMVRIRVPGGVVSSQQWLALDELAGRYGNGTLRLTTRQAFQLHGVPKWKLREAIAAINGVLLSTLAACGNVNRNVMCCPNPVPAEVHAAVYEWSKRLSERLAPRTRAYEEIWLAAPAAAAAAAENEEPLYGPTYLPRKFKVALAVPPSNDVDVLAHDLGLIAVVESGGLAGFDVAVGGGMGMSHGEPATYPNLGQVIGFCQPEQVLEVAEQVLAVQRDFGDRGNRKHARLKYTINDRGIDWFQGELQQRLGWRLLPARPYTFEHRGDRYGWVEGADGQWHLTLYVAAGRIADREGYPLRSGLRAVAREHGGHFRLTANQNVIVAGVAAEDRPRIDRLVAQYQLSDGRRESALRRNAMACVALPTCGLAMAESERYLPTLLGRVEALLAAAGLGEEEIVLRMTGCPNGCARPYLAEIGLVGKALGKYNVYLGGDFSGQRLARRYRENIGEDEILEALAPIVERYAAERLPGEHFGDFVTRQGF